MTLAARLSLGAAAMLAALITAGTFSAEALTPRCWECARYVAVGHVKPGDPIEYGSRFGIYGRSSRGAAVMLNPQPLPPRAGAYFGFH